MAAVDITISGMLYDKLNRTTQNVVLIGEATLTGLSVGGGPIYPPGPIKPPGGGGEPPTIWPGPGPLPHPEHPIVIPLPPNTPNVPPPGSPPVILPGSTPTHPITPPPAIVVDYPGIGKVVVPQPTQTASGTVPGA